MGGVGTRGVGKVNKCLAKGVITKVINSGSQGVAGTKSNGQRPHKHGEWLPSNWEFKGIMGNVIRYNVVLGSNQTNRPSNQEETTGKLQSTVGNNKGYKVSHNGVKVSVNGGGGRGTSQFCNVLWGKGVTVSKPNQYITRWEGGRHGIVGKGWGSPAIKLWEWEYRVVMGYCKFKCKREGVGTTGVHPNGEGPQTPAR